MSVVHKVIITTPLFKVPNEQALGYEKGKTKLQNLQQSFSSPGFYTDNSQSLHFSDANQNRILLHSASVVKNIWRAKQTATLITEPLFVL